MKKLLAAAAVIACLMDGTTAASARDWWIVDFGNDTCHPAPISPIYWLATLRQSADLQSAPSVKTWKYTGTDTVFMVQITASYSNGNNVTWEYLDSYQHCEKMRHVFLEDGTMTNYSDLQ